MKLVDYCKYIGKELRKLEAEFWKAADQLRANSKLTASEYSMPVLGLIFLRHAYNRYLKVRIELEKNLPSHPQTGLLHETEYFWKQAHWLTSRFPDSIYTDVEGLCKVVTQKEIASKDWSLSPGRYVGVGTSTDEDFDYEERLKEIHIELKGLHEEANMLVGKLSESGLSGLSGF